VSGNKAGKFKGASPRLKGGVEVNKLEGIGAGNKQESGGRDGNSFDEVGSC
jgi:hypothetical protein